MWVTMRLLLINPNTSRATTTAMVEIAAEAAQGRLAIEGATVIRGAAIVVDAAMLETAAEAVVELVDETDLPPFSGLIIAGFGDPGLERVRARTALPVTGIAEAAIAEAAAGGRRFSILMRTPGLVPVVAERVAAYGFGRQFAGVRLINAPPAGPAADPARLEAAILAACAAAIEEDGAEVIIIGSGPLASAARMLRSQASVPIVEPLPASVRLTMNRLRVAGSEGDAHGL
jgi:Asp/Glu/hydantoin racemase